MDSIYGSAAARVTRGLEWLNENGPAEWWDRVDTNTLDISDGDNCVLGQVFEAEANDHGVSSGYIYIDMQFDLEVQSLGFCATGGERDSHDLDCEWTQSIFRIRELVSA